MTYSDNRLGIWNIVILALSFYPKYIFQIDKDTEQNLKTFRRN